MNAAGRFARQPFADVSVSELVTTAGVQPPTLYHFFGDKEGIYVEWATTSIEDMGNRIRNGLAPPAEFHEALSHIARCLADPEYPDLLQVQRDVAMLARPESREEIMSALHQGVFEPLYAILLVGMERRLLRTEPVRKTAAVFVAVACSFRPGAPLHDPASPETLDWWVDRFLRGFGA